MTRDLRLTPARPDLAASKLRGLVEAARFVDGRAARVVGDVVDVRSLPRADAALATQLLHGETVTVYDEGEGWAWLQADRDGYVGYVLAEAIEARPNADAARDHRVIVNRTFVYPAADMKRPVLRGLPLDARVTVADVAGSFARLAEGGFVWLEHVAPVERGLDFAAVAEGLLGAPYLWGGKSVGGVDCSGLVQLAASMAGLDMPRDTDMQEACGAWVTIAAGDSRRRGDLLFWRGHVGVMSDASTLLHASGHHMLVVREFAAVAEARIARGGAPLSCVRRCARLASD